MKLFFLFSLWLLLFSSLILMCFVLCCNFNFWCVNLIFLFFLFKFSFRLFILCSYILFFIIRAPWYNNIVKRFQFYFHQKKKKILFLGDIFRIQFTAPIKLSAFWLFIEKCNYVDSDIGNCYFNSGFSTHIHSDTYKLHFVFIQSVWIFSFQLFAIHQFIFHFFFCLWFIQQIKNAKTLK